MKQILEDLLQKDMIVSYVIYKDPLCFEITIQARHHDGATIEALHSIFSRFKNIKRVKIKNFQSEFPSASIELWQLQ